MRHQLLAYLMDDLDPAQRQAVDEALKHDPELRDELQRLSDCLAAGGDQETCKECLPERLAQRTCWFVERATHARVPCGCGGRSASLSESRDNPAPSRHWSLADLTVAACILVSLSALVFPALRTNREAARLLKCEDNMHRLGMALADFAQWQRQGLPQVGANDTAGVYLIALAESGVLSREELAELVVCPSTPLAEQVAGGSVKIYIPTRQEYDALSGCVAVQVRRLMGGNYASSLGWRDRLGRMHQFRFVGRRTIPLLSDAPSRATAGYQSPNHGGCGQNVLFQDLHCSYMRTCESPDASDHWFLNDENQPAAGCHAQDIVLGPSEATPLVEVSAGR